MNGFKNTPPFRSVQFLAAIVSIVILGCKGTTVNDRPARSSPEWVKDAVFYEVNIGSFSKEGDFKAIKTRIPELKELGINVISIMPIHVVGELNRRGKTGSPYAVNDFYSVNPEFGTPEDLRSLVDAVHGQGMKIVIELNINYAAWDSKLIMEHPDWFIHNDEGAIVSPDPELYDIAQLDYKQHELRKYMIGMMIYWINELGIDGFKFSGAKLVPLDFWEIARKELDRIKPVILISEDESPSFHLDAFDITYSWNINNTLNRSFDGNCSIAGLDDSITAESLRFPKGALKLRFNSVYNDSDEKIRAGGSMVCRYLKPEIILRFTLPGIPLICNGEETMNEKKFGSENIFKSLCRLRKDHPALQYGSYKLLKNSSGGSVFSFLRFYGSDTIVTIVNSKKDKKEIGLNIPVGSSLLWRDELSWNNYRLMDSSLKIILPPLGCSVLTPADERISR